MKAISALFLTVVCYNLFAAPSMTIQNPVHPVVIKADKVTLVKAAPGIYDVKNQSGLRNRVSFLTNGRLCSLVYQNESGSFKFVERIKGNSSLCEEILNALKHAYRTSGCIVSFTIDTTNEEFTDVKSSCDFRADLQSEVTPV